MRRGEGEGGEEAQVGRAVGAGAMWALSRSEMGEGAEWKSGGRGGGWCSGQASEKVSFVLRFRL